MQKNKKLLELNTSFCTKGTGLNFSVDPPDDFLACRYRSRYQDIGLNVEARSNSIPEDWALEERGVDVRVVNAPWAVLACLTRKELECGFA